jgi:hypothetical protein
MQLVPLTEELILGASVPVTLSSPHLLPLANGGFAASWIWVRQVDANTRVMMRVFDSTGQAAGPEVQISSSPSPRAWAAGSMATLANGEFAIAWVDRLTSAGAQHIFARRFTVTGEPASDPVQITDDDDLNSYGSRLCSLVDGNIGVVWEAAARSDPA